MVQRGAAADRGERLSESANSDISSGSRMSGQSNVEDNTVAAAVNATAPVRNSPPVARRRHVAVAVISVYPNTIALDTV